MPNNHPIPEEAVKNIKDQESLLHFLREHLDWQLPDRFTLQIAILKIDKSLDVGRERRGTGQIGVDEHQAGEKCRPQAEGKLAQ